MAQLTEQQLHRLDELEFLGVDETDLAGLINPFKTRTPEEVANPHWHLLRLLRNPDYFYFTCKHVLKVELPPHQCVILREMWNRRFPMLIGARGLGKSFLLGVFAVLRALLKQGCKVVLTGSGFRQAKTIFAYCEKIFYESPVLRTLVKGDRNNIERGADRWIMRLGQSTITALPIGSGEKIRGERANCIICDEFASANQAIFEEVISGFGVVTETPVGAMKKAARRRVRLRLGMITAAEAYEQSRQGGNQLIIAGTATYQTNHFYRYYRRWKDIIESRGDPDKLRQATGRDVKDGVDYRDYSVMRIPHDHIPEGYYDKSQVERSRYTINESAFLHEFGACFSTDSNGFFKHSLIDRCVCNEPVAPEGCEQSYQFAAVTRGYPNRRYVYGIDPASERDNFAIVVLELHNDHRRVVYCWTTDRHRHNSLKRAGKASEGDAYYSWCARKIRDLMRIFPCEAIALDSQGGGQNGVLEALHDRSQMEQGELPIWSVAPEHVLHDGKERDSDDKAGLHIVELFNPALATAVAAANHGLKKDLETRTLLFPHIDPIQMAVEADHEGETDRIHDTYADCVAEIEQVKEELETIVVSQTPGTNRETWNTPETKDHQNKKGRLRKDRYSALLMANYAARRLSRHEAPPPPTLGGGFVGRHTASRKPTPGPMYSGPEWFVRPTGNNPTHYGFVSPRGDREEGQRGIRSLY